MALIVVSGAPGTGKSTIAGATEVSERFWSDGHVPVRGRAAMIELREYY